MSFSDLVRSAQDVCLNVLGTLTATIHFQNSTPDAAHVPVILKNPAYEDDYTPGSDHGSGVVIIFIQLSVAQSLVALPLTGDTVTLHPSEIVYDVFRTAPIRVGSGHTLYLRRKQQQP